MTWRWKMFDASRRELYDFLDNSKPEVLQAIREKHELNDEIKRQLNDAMKEFKTALQFKDQATVRLPRKEAARKRHNATGKTADDKPAQAYRCRVLSTSGAASAASRICSRSPRP